MLTHHLEQSSTQSEVGQLSRLVAAGAILLVTSLFLTMWGIDWGLPSSERLPYYGGDVSQFESSQGDRLYQTAPYDTYHPDETAIFNALSNMSPSELDFNPRYFNYPSFNIYLTGAVVQVASQLGWVDVRADKAYYIANPEAMGEIIQLGRFVAVAYSAAGVILLWLTVGLLLGWRTGFLSGFLLAIMPLWVRNSHFSLVNVPQTTWMIAVMFFSVLALKRQNMRWLYVGALCSGFAASTKYNGGFAIIAVLFVGWILLQKRDRRPVRFATFFMVAGLLAATAFFLTSPYILLDFPTFREDILFEADRRAGQFDIMFLLRSLVVAQGTILALFSTLGFGITLSRFRQTEYQFLLVWFVAGFATMAISDQDFVRYLISGLPILAVMAAIGIGTIGHAVADKVRGDNARRLTWTAVVAVAVVPTLLYSIDLVRTTLGPDIRLAMSRYIDSEVPAGTTIYIQGGLYFDEPTVNSDRFHIVSGVPEDSSIFETRSCVVTHPGWPVEREWLAHQPGAETIQPERFVQHTNRLFTLPVEDFSVDWTYTDLEILLYCSPEVGRE